MRKKKKNPAAVALAARRHKSLTKAQRSEIASKAARAKWQRIKDLPEDEQEAAKLAAVSAANEARRTKKAG